MSKAESRRCLCATHRAATPNAGDANLAASCALAAPNAQRAAPSGARNTSSLQGSPISATSSRRRSLSVEAQVNCAAKHAELPSSTHSEKRSPLCPALSPASCADTLAATTPPSLPEAAIAAPTWFPCAPSRAQKCHLICDHGKTFKRCAGAGPRASRCPEHETAEPRKEGNAAPLSISAGNKTRFRAINGARRQPPRRHRRKRRRHRPSPWPSSSRERTRNRARESLCCAQAPPCTPYRRSACPS